MTHSSASGASTGSNPALQLEVQADRRLIRSGSTRHLVLRVKVPSVRSHDRQPRTPMSVGLVLDRSGSMHGEKMATARQAALAVLERLDERDRVAAVIFDDRVDVLQQGAAATPDVKWRLGREIANVHSRGATALHEGWLAGCNAIAPDGPNDGALVRCFLLTDGLANRGLTDVEQIASQAAAVRENAGIGTSTFGIGADYNEALLGPMAVAGGGQFHHLRGTHEIASAFLGELGEMGLVVAAGARLEIDAALGTTLEMVSPYRLSQTDTTANLYSALLGDLLAGEEREAVLRLRFASQDERPASPVRVRTVWRQSGSDEVATDWHEVLFRYANDGAIRAETPDLTAQRLVGVHHAERARRRAIELSRAGDLDAARAVLHVVGAKIAEYAGSDLVLLEALAGLRAAEEELERRGYQPLVAKEAYYASQARSRGQRDLRQR